MRIGKPYSLRIRATTAGQLVLAREFFIELSEADMLQLGLDAQKAATALNSLLAQRQSLQEQLGNVKDQVANKDATIADLEQKIAALKAAPTIPTDAETDAALTAFHSAVEALPSDALTATPGESPPIGTP